MALVGRIREALNAGRQAVAEIDGRRPSGDGPPLKDAAAALALGQDADAADILQSVRRLADVNFLITTSRQLAQFQEPGLITEFLPLDEADTAPPAGEARLIYAARRLSIVCEKWGIGVLLPLGPASAEGLAAMREALPFLPSGENVVHPR